MTGFKHQSYSRLCDTLFESLVMFAKGLQDYSQLSATTCGIDKSSCRTTWAYQVLKLVLNLVFSRSTKAELMTQKMVIHSLTHSFQKYVSHVPVILTGYGRGLASLCMHVSESAAHVLGV